MLWELALFSILVPAAYWGVHYLRRRPFGSTTFGWMLIAAAAMTGVALIGRRQDAGSWADALGVIGLGIGTFALIVAPLLRVAARWAVAADRLRLAAVLVDIRDLLQPGMGGRDDKRMVAALRDVKEGRVDHAVAALEALRARAPAGAVSAIDERITLLYLSAQRWQDAVRWAERTVLREATVDTGRPRLSPSVCVELIGARLRIGEVDAAAEMAERFEAGARGVPELIFLVYRLHLMVLAHLGRVADVDRLLDPALATYVSRAARRYWAGVARHAAGDVPAARLAFEEARGLAGRDRRARVLVDLGLRELDQPPPTPTPRAVALADRLAASPLVIPPRAPGRRATVTSALVVGNLVVAAICGLALAGWGDTGSVIRVGANLRQAVAHGEAWRLASSVFVHIGVIHLLVNLLALWSLGRLVEGLFGKARMLAIYGAAGLAGAAASHLWSQAGVSAGASGAIFGLLGAALVELALHRNRYRREWRRSLLGALAFVTVAQLAIGFTMPIIDQWAHGGGLLAGAAAGAILSPGWRWAEGRAATWGARLAATAVVAVFAWGAWGAATTDYGDTLAALPRAIHQFETLEVEAPAGWSGEGGELIDEELYVVLDLAVDPPAEHASSELAARLGDLEHVERPRAIGRGFETVRPADQARVPLPAGWRGSEWIVTHDDELGSTIRYRLLCFVGETEGLPIAGVLYVPDVLSSSGADGLGAILKTIRPRS